MSAISSPAFSPNPIESPSFQQGQEIAFIYNRTDLISGIITQINLDSTFDLECKVPVQVRQVTMERGTPKITFKTILESRPFLKASPADPRTIVVKTVTSLSDLGMESIDDPARGHKQSSISAWRPSIDLKGNVRLNRIPRLTEFLAPLVGHFFDSSLFYYRIYCWRASYEIRGGGTIPEETLLFPKKKPFYTSFSKCYNRYLKEYLQNLQKWNRVEIQAILPQDVAKEAE